MLCSKLYASWYNDAHVSVEHSATTSVAQAEACVLRLAVLPDTRSGETR
jgi:hypothetical protein